MMDAVRRWSDQAAGPVVRYYENPAALALPEQLAAFAATDVLISPHGAGIALSPIMAEGSTVIELWGDSWYHYELFANIATLAGLSYKAVRCESVGRAPGIYKPKEASDYNMKCAPQDLVQHVAEAVDLWARKTS